MTSFLPGRFRLLRSILTLAVLLLGHGLTAGYKALGHELNDEGNTEAVPEAADSYRGNLRAPKMSRPINPDKLAERWNQGRFR